MSNEKGVRPITIAVDLDGCLAAYDEWEGLEQIGDPIPGAKEMVNNLHGSHAGVHRIEVVIHTTRVNGELNERDPEEAAEIVRDWLDEHGFEYEFVWTGRGKPIAGLYVDDRAIVCDPQKYGDKAMQKITFETVEERIREELRGEYE